jgi:hypothetical protein
METILNASHVHFAAIDRCCFPYSINLLLVNVLSSLSSYIALLILDPDHPINSSNPLFLSQTPFFSTDILLELRIQRSAYIPLI